jgi:hypothetical protein
MEVTGDSIGGELLTEPLGVGIGDLPEEQLGSYSNNFDSH